MARQVRRTTWTNANSPSQAPRSRPACWPMGTVTAPALLDVYPVGSHRPPRSRIAVLSRCLAADSAREQAAAAQALPPSGRGGAATAARCADRDQGRRRHRGGEVTTYGSSTAHAATARTADAEVIRRLREAGAVFVGKTNVPEMTLWSFAETVGVRCDEKSVEHRLHPGVAAAVAAARRWPRDWHRWRWGPTAWGRSVFRRRGAGCCGIKPQRDRTPSPHDDAWNGLVVNGPMARTVEDAALFLDVTGDESGFVAAAAKDPGTLRIAVSTKVPLGVVTRVGTQQRAAVEESAALLRELGIRSSCGIPDYPSTAMALAACPGTSVGLTTMCGRCLIRSDWRLAPGSSPGWVGLISDERMTRIRAAESQKWPNVFGPLTTTWTSSSLRARRWGRRERRLPAARGGLDDDVGRGPCPVSGAVQRDGPAGGRRAVGFRPGRNTDIDPARGPTRPTRPRYCH